MGGEGVSPLAGETGPDLSFAEEAVRELMDDRCEITFDPEGGADDVFDPVTLLETPPAPDSLIIYQGPCTLKASPTYTTGAHGGETVQQRDYVLKLPMTAPEIPVGAVVRMTAARRDPQEVDQRFSVSDVATGTFSVSRKISLDRLP